MWDIPVISAKQRRKYARVAVASDGIACAQKEAPAVDAGCSHPASRRLQGRGSPRSGQRLRRLAPWYLLNQWKYRRSLH